MATSPSRNGDRTTAAGRLGLSSEAVVHVIGWDDDCDEAFLDELSAGVSEVVLDDTGDVVDGVLLWWRQEDGDLADGLLDALAMLADSAPVWLMTPRPGRPGHMTGSDVKEAVQVAGMQITSSIGIGGDWQAARLTAPRQART